MRLHRILAVTVAAVLFALTPARAAETGPVMFFAAASLADVLPIIEKQYEAAGGGKVIFSFAASGVLAKQIEASAGVDIFMSADNVWMDHLDNKGFVQKASRKNLLGNHLVLVGPKDTKTALTILQNFPLKQALAGGRLAIGDPASVPAGNYAKAALTSLGVWHGISDQVANGENVRVVLQYVARGEAPLGIVYTTDAMAEPGVKIIADFPQNSYSPITYPIALTKDAWPEAAKFVTYLSGPVATAIFQKAGFIIVGK